MIKGFDIEGWAKEVLLLQKESYRVEAEYIGTDEIPPLKESLEQLKECGEEFIGYFEDGKLVGALSYKMVSNVLDIHRVMVHPMHFRKGIARELLSYVESFADEIIVSTGAMNHPAVKLYLKSGFEKTGEQTVGNGIHIANFRKQMKRDR